MFHLVLDIVASVESHMALPGLGRVKIMYTCKDCGYSHVQTQTAALTQLHLIVPAGCLHMRCKEPTSAVHYGFDSIANTIQPRWHDITV